MVDGIGDFPVCEGCTNKRIQKRNLRLDEKAEIGLKLVSGILVSRFLFLEYFF